MVPANRGRRQPPAAQVVVERVDVGSAELPQRLGPQTFRDLGAEPAVLAESLGRPPLALEVHVPPVEEAGDRRVAGGQLPVVRLADELGGGALGVALGAADRRAGVAVPTGVGVTADADPHLPNPWGALT